MKEECIELDGPSGPVRIAIDTWGVPHISAGSADDVFFGQGFMAARSRLFQLDWWRRRGLGRMAEVLGPDYVERDRAARLFVYRGDMRAEWLAYGDDARTIVERFAAGVNAWIARTRGDPGLLSPEFALIGYVPDFWDASDIVRIRSHGLYANVEQEVARAITLRDFGPEVEALRRHLDPPKPLTVPEGLDLSVISSDILDVYRRALGPVTAGLPTQPRAAEGSNNWVVSGARTATGRPILANDPHRAMTAPSLRYIVHLTCPDFDVIGAGEPMLPGVSIGHNGHVAFGLTIWNADQEDLYVYDLHPDDPTLYRYRDGWERMVRQTETIAVKGRDAVQAELAFTRHGPVICSRLGQGKAFAIRAAWLQPGMAPYLSSIGNLRSRSAGDVRKVLNRWGAPGLNHVYADASGSIGWSPRALVPRRPNWDGLLPVPGDGRYEWDGFHHASDLPQIVDPACGWLGSANQMNLPSDGSWKPLTVSHEWYSPFRMDRIREVLQADPALTVAASAALQNDYLSTLARRVCSRLPPAFGAPEAEQARALLAGWDHRMLAGSAAAALFETWFRGPLRDALRRHALASIVAADRLEAALAISRPKEDIIADAAVDMLLFDRMAEDALHPVMEATLIEAMAQMTQAQGRDCTAWCWGNASRSQLRHLAANHLAPQPAWALGREAPKSGSSETVGLAVQAPGTGVQVTGASFRLVIEVGAWDNSIAINTPGQDGDPTSPHAGDLYDLWLGDGYFPLAYSPAAVAAATTSTLTLQPALARQDRIA